MTTTYRFEDGPTDLAPRYIILCPACEGQSPTKESVERTFEKTGNPDVLLSTCGTCFGVHEIGPTPRVVRVGLVLYVGAVVRVGHDPGWYDPFMEVDRI